MKNSIRVLFAAAAFAVATSSLVLAQRQPLRSEGKILILDTDRAIKGDIARQGDRFHIRRDVSSVWLPAARVRFVGANWDEVIAFLRGRINANDPDERLRLARWCQNNGVYDHAVLEAKAALQLQRSHRAARQFLRIAERQAEIAKRPQRKAVAPPTAPPLPSLDLNAESTGLFVTKVQPILMNACARCHAAENRKGFHLQRVQGNGVGSRLATRYNLVNTVKHIRLDNASLSRLLIKSVSAHGPAAKPPIKSARSKPYMILRAWVDQTIRTNPHLREEAWGTVKPKIVKTEQAKSVPQPTAPPTQGPIGFAAIRAGAPPLKNSPRVAPRLLPRFKKPLPIVSPQKSEPTRSVPRYVSDKLKPIQPRDVAPVRRADYQVPASGRVTRPAQQIARPIPSSPAPLNYQPGDVYDPQEFNRKMHPKR